MTSVAALVDDLLDKIDTVDPELRCFITVDHAGARRAATHADRRRTAGRPLGPLDGVPVAVKDNIDTAGLRTTYGLGLLADRIPLADAEIVRRLRRAGAVIMGKTNLTELACGTVGGNLHYGDCRNPLDPDRYPGGSSSGSAAAVAAGLVRHAIGTDTGASIRHPASCCGVVGLKPTFGRTSTAGVSVGARRLDHVGPIAASVGDAADLLAAIQNDDADDPTRLLGRPLRRPRVAMLTGEFLAHCRPDVLAAHRAVPTVLEALGARVDELDLELDLQTVDDTANVLGADLFHTYGQLLADGGRDAVGPDLWRWHDHYEQVDPDAYATAVDEQERITREVASRMRGFDLLVSPTTRTGTGTYAEGASESRMMRMGNLSIWDLTGHPALTVPFGRCAQDLPLGLQIVGHHGDDARVLQLGAAVEQATLG